MLINFWKFSICIALVTFGSGCGLVSAVFDSFHSAGVTASDRRGLLPDNLKSFNNALYWGKPEVALNFVLPEGRASVIEQLKISRDKERLVDSAVTYMDFADDAYTADVAVTFKFFKVPFYIVTERKEAQKWRFSLANGWKLESRTVEESKG